MSHSQTSCQRILTRGRIAGGGFFTRGVNVAPASWEQCSRLQQSRLCRYWFVCCIYSSCDSQCLSKGQTNPTNWPFPLWIWTTI